jgi:hypothetical protein
MTRNKAILVAVLALGCADETDMADEQLDESSIVGEADDEAIVIEYDEATARVDVAVNFSELERRALDPTVEMQVEIVSPDGSRAIQQLGFDREDDDPGAMRLEVPALDEGLYEVTLSHLGEPILHQSMELLGVGDSQRGKDKDDDDDEHEDCKKGKVIKGSDGKDDLRGTKHRDKIYGYAGKDWLRGFECPDELYGGKGADELWGHEGRDFLDGGKGKDVCRGGGGKDRYRNCEKVRED